MQMTLCFVSQEKAIKKICLTQRQIKSLTGKVIRLKSHFSTSNIQFVHYTVLSSLENG